MFRATQRFRHQKKPLTKQFDEWLFEKFSQKILLGARKGEPLSETSLHNLNVSMGEFCMHCRKRDGKRALHRL